MSEKEKSENEKGNETNVDPTTTPTQAAKTTSTPTSTTTTTSATTTTSVEKMTRYERFVKAITPEKEFLPLKLTWY